MYTLPHHGVVVDDQHFHRETSSSRAASIAARDMRTGMLAVTSTPATSVLFFTVTVPRALPLSPAWQ